MKKKMERLKPVKTKMTTLKAILAICLLVFIDQLTKFLAVICLSTRTSFPIIEDVFELSYLENQSAAFGMDLVTFFQRIFRIQYFYDNPGAFLFAKMAVLAVFTIIVCLLMVLFYLRTPEKKKFVALDIIIIMFIAGAIGNLIDRLVNHYVIDFFYFKLINFPVFNVADIYVTVAAFLLIVLGLFYYQESDYEEIIGKPSNLIKKHLIL